MRFNIILPYQQQLRNSLSLELICRKPQIILYFHHAPNTIIYGVVLITSDNNNNIYLLQLGWRQVAAVIYKYTNMKRDVKCWLLS